MVVVLSSRSFRRRIITFPLDCKIALLVVVVARVVFITVVAEALEVAAAAIDIVDDFVSFVSDGSFTDDLSLSAAAAIVDSAESPKVGFLLGKGSPKGGGLHSLAIYSCKHNCK